MKRLEPLSLWKLRNGHIVMVISLHPTCFSSGGRLKKVRVLREDTNTEDQELDNLDFDTATLIRHS